MCNFRLAQLQGKDVIEAYLVSSLAKKTQNVWSDIDIIIIKQTDMPFLERPREFFDLFDLGIPVDILVYSPQEVKEQEKNASGFWKDISENRLRIL